MILKKSTFLFVFYFIVNVTVSFAQQKEIKKDQYQIGPDERLLITVHIFGEVRIPGEYLVPDDTDILELISKAGGPTEFSNLNKVKISRGLTVIPGVTKSAKKRKTNSNNTRQPKKYKQVIKVDLKKILDNERYYKKVPRLQPGDVVRVGRNAWFTWQTVIRVISQVAIIVQAWYWYTRI